MRGVTLTDQTHMGSGLLTDPVLLIWPMGPEFWVSPLCMIADHSSLNKELVSCTVMESCPVSTYHMVLETAADEMTF